MKVSIIIVCLNADKTIEAAIRSVQDQKYKNIEKVFIDGGSSDGTLEIIRKYLKTDDKFISENDKGIYDAMNKGVKMATGDIIYFLNSDDSLFDSDVVGEMVDFFSLNQNYKIVYGKVYCKNMPLDVKETQPKQINSVSGFITQVICHQAVFVKRSIFDTIGLFNIKYRFTADQEWLLRTFIHYGDQFIYWDRIIAFYDYQGQSYQHRDIVREEKREVLIRYFSRVTYLLYWIRYILIRGIKKKLFNEPW